MIDSTQVESFSRETDVLVLGFGLAGACAAIEAIDTDPSAKVLICEKMPQQYAGGNSRASGQSLLISDDPTALVDYQRQLSSSNPLPDGMLEWWASEMVMLEPWIMERAKQAGSEYIHGTGFTDRSVVLEFPEIGAAEAVRHTATILPIPAGVWLAFEKNVAQRAIDVEYEAAVVDLIQDTATREVIGAAVQTRSGLEYIRARRGVVMAVGGYENNPQMQRDFCGYDKVKPLGTPGNTGDGIKIMAGIGAQLWHMRNFGQSGGIWPGIEVPGRDTVFLRNLFWQSFSWIEIAADDRRFYNETAELQLRHYKELKHGHWVDTPHVAAGPVHMIFDEATRLANTVALRAWTWNIAAEGLDWSDDNSAEVEKGWILRADTIEELAAQMHRDPAAVRAAVDAYNSACARGVDDEFGRHPATLAPIESGPFYALPIVPALVCTSGGARRNTASEVLDWNDQVIPRLYEAGELGSMISDLYQNGSYLTEAMISGRTAGRNAVRQTPKS